MEFYYNTPFVFKIPQYLKNRVSTNIYIYFKKDGVHWCNLHNILGFRCSIIFPRLEVLSIERLCVEEN
jgi:hypothetical protein